MTQGTVSVLFGCHSPIHSLVVLVAWVKLYHRLPSFWQIVCIFIHDIGHWGKQYLDDYEAKKRHGELGAKVAKYLFGQKGYDLILGHNPYNGTARSALHDPDKYSWVIAPIWWMTSNAIFEPKLQRKGSTKRESAIMFKEAMRENMNSGFKELGHEIYMKQWGHYNSKCH
ncbi:hypothetical protein LCGC14_2064290 [marine sediment metagenome]|uniref:HD domain-containing protein n=1 Tax=marine sediment metagenome TaxID=412755 RepID=A0A0F9HHA1_9ZZZZ